MWRRPMWRSAIPRGLGVLIGLGGLVVFLNLGELIGGVVAGIVLFIVAVALGSVGLIRSERRRRERRKRPSQ